MNRFLADFRASFVVFLVALPLSMGIAIASGLTPATGLLCGIVGGIVVGMLSGSPLQVSGPAAGLTVVVYGIVQSHGSGGLAVFVLVAGLLQIAAGLCKLGQWFRAVPPAVIHGMLAGIGIIILASQFHVMIDDLPKENALENLRTIPAALAEGLIPDGDAHHVAARIGALTILMIVCWQLFIPKALRSIPGALVAILVATIIAEAMALPIKRVTIPTDLAAAISLPGSGDWQHLLSMKSWGLILALAIIASAETLLCATAVDAMHQGVRTKYDQELCAQGVGNTLCGLIGALPMTGVIVRSGANVKAGAVSRWSAVLHGVWILAAVLFLPGMLSRIPTASLAALLVYTGFTLVYTKHLRELLKYGWSEVAIFLITMVMIVCTDLLTGVIAGIILAAVKLLYRFSRLEVNIKSENPAVTVMRLRGSCTFLALPKLSSKLAEIPPGTKLHVHLEELHYIDHACLELFMKWRKQHKAMGGQLYLDWGHLHAHFRGRSDRKRKPRPALSQAKPLLTRVGTMERTE